MIIKKHIKKPEVLEEKTTLKSEPAVDEEKIDLFNLDNIDFSQRSERRRGDRRRGFRRIDDRNLISRAREEAEAIKEAASKEGYKEGLVNAKSDIEEVRNAISVFMSAKQEVFDYIATDILQISVDIAKKIIKKEIEQDPNLILDNIAAMMKGLSREEAKITIEVNPNQVSTVKQQIPQIIEITGLEAKISVIPKEEIEEGGCVLITTNGVIDATIDSQLSVIMEALKEIG